MLDRIAREVRPEVLTVCAWALVTLMILTAYLHSDPAKCTQHSKQKRESATAFLLKNLHLLPLVKMVNHKKQLVFKFARTMDDVLQNALQHGKKKNTKKKKK